MSIRQASIWPLFIAVFVAVVCFPHLSGQLLLIGNSDRLNTFLNIRMFEVQSLLRIGRIPVWNDHLFGGFDMTTLHYMLPILHPITRVLELAPERIVYLLGLWAILSYYLVGLGAYLLLKDLTRDRFLAAVGAIIYLSGYQVYFRAFQVDDAVINYAMLPLAILMVRRLSMEFSISHFVGLFTCVVLIMVSFLQESSYVLIMVCSYTLFAAWQCKSWRVIVFSGSAIGCAIIFTFPRVLGIYLDLKTYTRGTAAGLNSEWEFFRLFYDGFFGRNFEEALKYTHLHVHEGYATYTSVFAPLVLVIVGFLCSSRIERLWLVGCIGFFDHVVSTVIAVPIWAHIALLLIAVSTLFAKPSAISDRDELRHADDLPFYLGAFLLCTLFILHPWFRMALYYVFLKMDFTHSRLSILVIFAMAASIPILIGRFVQRYQAPGAEASSLEAVVLKPPYWFIIFVVVGALCDWAALMVSWALFGDFRTPVQLGSVNFILPAIFYVIAMVAIFVAFGVAFLISRSRTSSAAPIYALALCGFLVASGARYTFFELFGIPNRTFPIAFQNHNMFDAPPDVFRLPRGEELRRVHEKLQSDMYRSAFLFDPSVYRTVLNFQSYLALFWQLRVIDGYGPAVPTRLTELPWPPNVVGVHSIRFANHSDLSWPVLAMLNVKYAIAVDDAFFYNIKSETDHSTFDSSDLRVLTNPFHVTPRYFFAKHVAPMSMPDNDQAAPSDCPDDAAPGNVADDGKPYPSSAMVSTRGVRLPVDPRLCSIAAGFGEGKEFSTEGDVAVEFLEDQVIARMSPSPQERFLVLNERDNPFWKAYAGGRELKVWETNLAMRGVVVPKDTAEVSFFFRPFTASYSSLGIVAVGLTSFLCCLLIFAGVIGGKIKRAEQWDKLGRSDRVR